MGVHFSHPFVAHGGHSRRDPVFINLGEWHAGDVRTLLIPEIGRWGAG